MTDIAAINAKPKLLVIELWGLGDLVIATPFLQAASEKYDVTILAKPYAKDLQARFWPGVKVIPFHAPWTAFKLKDKYRLYAWPWREIFRLRKLIREQRFDLGVSGRGESAGGDPRDHFLLTWFGVKRRIGFPRVGSQIFLTETLRRAGPEAHRYENWRVLGRAIGVELPGKEGVGEGRRGEVRGQRSEVGSQTTEVRGQKTEGGGRTAEGKAESRKQKAEMGTGAGGSGKQRVEDGGQRSEVGSQTTEVRGQRTEGGGRTAEGKAETTNQKPEMGTEGRGRREILVHSGAGQPVRVWPLERYRGLVQRLRQKGYTVQVACDPEQLGWWQAAGEAGAVAPKTVTELLELIDRAAVFIGNDSGPGHLAAFAGVPTFTIFGPQLPEWFAPLHPAAEWVGGKACPYKPCSDYCRFAQPVCLTNWAEEEIWQRVEDFLSRAFSDPNF